ncbi:MAG: hypothetical protein QMC27_02865 [Flavobacteriaceae bacterium]
MWLSTWSSDAEYKKAHSEEIDDFWTNYFMPKTNTCLVKLFHARNKLLLGKTNFSC